MGDVIKVEFKPLTMFVEVKQIRQIPGDPENVEVLTEVENSDDDDGNSLQFSFVTPAKSVQLGDRMKVSVLKVVP
jgi:hypothetical protein